ncbi:MAG: N-acetylmuramoyl-L-alanine amidase, partial [Phaeodactylibacter sp.]|nr:N-acetylmuramoyl-L-alanine amidase [Phaeodactylibacter sp.]
VNLENLEVHCFNPGKTPEGQNPTVPLEDRSFCPCPHPDYMARLDWCPTGDCPVDATPAFTTVTHLIVHHSAGSNTSSDWAARVRSIWNGHVNGNGWDDIGYNWLIDPNGVLYQGRGENVLGAHFCGTNGGTMGVCMMGTYTDVLPTPEAINTLKELLAWKACLEDIDPLDFSFHASSGLNLFHISGHRDGCATECPGELFYNQFDLLRDTVAYHIANDCSPIPGPNNLTAAITLDTVVELAWQDYTDDEIAFELFRSLGGADDFQLLVTLPENTTTYQDLGLIPVAGYDYMVRAVNDTIASGFSNVASVMPIISGIDAVENP